jgi:hypothetical protein
LESGQHLVLIQMLVEAGHGTQSGVHCVAAKTVQTAVQFLEPAPGKGGLDYAVNDGRVETGVLDQGLKCVCISEPFSVTNDYVEF